MATLTETVSASANHDFLEAVIRMTGMEGVFSGPTQYTLLGPSDGTIFQFAQNLGYRGASEVGSFEHLIEVFRLFNGGAEDQTTFWTNYILGHRLDGMRTYNNDLIDGFTTAAGVSYNVPQSATGQMTDGNAATVDPSFVVGSDQGADNGRLHEINGFLMNFVLPDLRAPFVNLKIGNDYRNVYNVGRGDDFVAGRGGNDHVIAGRGNDVATGGWGRDKLLGNAGNDRLFGDAGSDKLFGGFGADTLTGGAGDDVLYGGRGADVFVMTDDGARDLLPDFRANIDKIDVRELGITSFDDISVSYSKGRIVVDLGEVRFTIFGNQRNMPDADDFLFAVA